MAVALCHVTLPEGVTELFGVSPTVANGINGKIVFTPSINEVVSTGGGLALPIEYESFVKDGQFVDGDGNPGLWIARPDSTDRTFVYLAKAALSYEDSRNHVREFHIAVPAADNAILTDLLAVPGPPSTFITKGEPGEPGTPGAPGADSTVAGPPGTPGGSDSATAAWVRTGADTRAALNEYKRIQYVNVYNGFFNGQDSTANPSIWANTSHLNTTGLPLWAAYVIAHAGIIGPTPKIVWFGDSWIAQDPSVLTTATTSAYPGATVVVSGVAGNTSTDMLTRFDADVPADADYVIFNEPGVNDIYQGYGTSLVASQLAALTSKIQALGAMPVYTGVVPLSDHAAPALARHTELKSLIGDGSTFPAPQTSALAIAARPEPDSFGLGGGLAKRTTGTVNTTIGNNAGKSITTGAFNTLIGREAGTGLATGINNTAVGANSLRASIAGGSNTAIGAGALSALTTATYTTGVGSNAGLLSKGQGNLFIGANAGYSPNGDPANATTTSSSQTIIGTESGQGSVSATAQNEITTVGYRAIAGGYNATALGSKAVALYHDSLAIGRGATASSMGTVAIGTDSNGVGAVAPGYNEFALGTANHVVNIRGRLTVAPRTPSSGADTQGAIGDITSDDSYVYAKTSTGWKRAALTTW